MKFVPISTPPHLAVSNMVRCQSGHGGIICEAESGLPQTVKAMKEVCQSDLVAVAIFSCNYGLADEFLKLSVSDDDVDRKFNFINIPDNEDHGILLCSKCFVLYPRESVSKDQDQLSLQIYRARRPPSD